MMVITRVTEIRKRGSKAPQRSLKMSFNVMMKRWSKKAAWMKLISKDK